MGRRRHQLQDRALQGGGAALLDSVRVRQQRLTDMCPLLVNVHRSGNQWVDAGLTFLTISISDSLEELLLLSPVTQALLD